MNYATLQTDAADYLHRTDLTAKMPGFIALAESTIFRELHVKDMAVSVAGTTTGEYATLPADFGTVQRVTAVAGGSEYSLDYKSQDYTPTGQTYPNQYALENNKLRIWGASTGQAYTLYYIPNLAALSNSNSTNWMLDNAPDLYLYATALEAAKYIRDQQEVATLTPIVGVLIDSVRRASERKGQPATGSLQIKPRR
jgi:hypothetical protein